MRNGSSGCTAVRSPTRTARCWRCFPRTIRRQRVCGSAWTRSAPGTRESPPRSSAALSLAARTEGIVFDPVYTGRALAGLIAEVADGHIGSGSTVVLMHTGGLPGLFGSAEFLAGLGDAD